MEKNTFKKLLLVASYAIINRLQTKEIVLALGKGLSN